MHQKYDLLVDKGFRQQELAKRMVFLPKIHPGHQKYRGDYFYRSMTESGHHI